MNLIYKTFLTLLLVLIPCAARAADQNKLIEIPSGITRLQLRPVASNAGDYNKADNADYIIKAWRDNANAHGYYSIMFFDAPRNLPIGGLGSDGKTSSKATNAQFSVIGVDDKNGSARAAIITEEAADCSLVDYRFLFKNDAVFLFEADKDMTKSFCDTNSVKFILYKLVKNDGEFNPSFFFKRLKTFSALKKYDDAEKAFQSEERRLITSAK